MIGYLTLLRTQWPLLAFGFVTVFWGNFGQSFFVGWFSADIQASVGLSASAYGSAYSLGTLAAAVTVAWAGAIIDRVSLRTYVLSVSAGLCCAALLLSQASTLWMLIPGFFLLRLFGQSLLPHTGMTTMARYFDDNRGKAISVAMSGVPVGEVVLPQLAVMLIARIGWQYTFLVVALGVVLILVPSLLWLLHKAAPQQERHDDAQAQMRRDNAGSSQPVAMGRSVLLKDYRYWLALPALMASPFIMTAIFIHQNFIVVSKGWTLSWLATCFVVYGGMHWVCSLISGVLVDRFKAVRLLPFILLPMLGALLLITFASGTWVALGMMILLGIGAGGTPPVTGALWAEVYGTRALGTIRSMNMAIVVLFSAISPVLVGYFIDRGTGVAGIFGACALYVAVAMVLISLSYPLNRAPAGVDSSGRML
ncbi:MAG: MFS transporter [Gammaproteobacteria bacterium]|nr:MFS transporter [Gammaproteobacteria bacterium]